MTWSTKSGATMALVVALGCARGGGVAELDPPPPGAAGTLPGDPIRAQLREILVPCQRSMHTVVDEGRIRRSRYHRIERALAIVVAQVSVSAANAQPGGNSAHGAVWRSERCTGANGDHPICSRALGAPAYGDEIGFDEDQLDEFIEVPVDQVRHAIGAVDDLLWSEPNSEEWSEEQWSEWAETRRGLSRACLRLQRAVDG